MFLANFCNLVDDRKNLWEIFRCKPDQTLENVLLQPLGVQTWARSFGNHRVQSRPESAEIIISGDPWKELQATYDLTRNQTSRQRRVDNNLDT